MAKITKAQQVGLAKLAHVLFEQSPIPCTIHGNIKTGVNTGTLHNLRRNGYITCSEIYTGGRVSPDIKLVQQRCNDGYDDTWAARCSQEEISHSEGNKTFRRCVRDLGHVGAHTFGNWSLR